MNTPESPSLSHTDDAGKARMVDVSGKAETVRTARAVGAIRCRPETLLAIERNQIAKGDVLGVARLAGLQAAKRTAELIPLCHPLRLTDIDVSLALVPPDALEVVARVRAVDRTGVEMEALTACAIAALTVYDMVKAIDREMVVGPFRLIEKTGGASGDVHAADRDPGGPS